MNLEINNSINIVSHIHTLCVDYLQKQLSENGFENFASSHGHILFQLSKVNAMPMNELSKKINRDKSTTTVLVRKLENEGYVVTVPSEEDKRSKMISLTEKGKKYNQVTSDISNQLMTKFYANFSEEEKSTFTGFLAKICDNFEN